ncbi:type I polyketide synthase [Streptomyces cyanogenus]|uniref:Polyketide synthase PksJ n=1 Tax=Streptomyces cyanogenus TaxID=80860 RepID=A0ABX7TKE2_STRCY|nr:type I polyketide synthase [Streptomyces cyanogenus]QTD97142.1 Polyketide synthase PksJ [Streptomyces cyanogenus]
MTPPQTPVAVVGMAVLLPGARDLDAYWRNLRDGTDAITGVPADRWDADYYHPGSAAGPAVAGRVYCRRGGFVAGPPEVEVTRYGIMPASVAGTEPDQLIALDVAAAALADAGGTERLPDRHRIGVVLGRGGYLTPGLARLDQRVRTAHQLTRTLGELLPDLAPGQLDRIRDAFTERLGPDSPDAAIGLVPNLAASRIANRLDLRGPAYTVDAACASSLVAVDQAVTALSSGRCDLMLAGGVHHCHDITLWSVFSQLRALSPTERIRPFHRDADGILIGEGTGVVVLKRLVDAERDGDRVYAVIRGTGVAGDGRTAGLVTPDPGGQTRAVREAWRAAGLDPAAPDSIGLLEAHGTATPAGDTAELTTLAEVFGPGTSGAGDGGRPVLGSVKSMIGHTMPAAGVAGLVKAALALHHRTLLPTLHCDDPHPALATTRFHTLERARPWETGASQRVRRAAVNAFGFGGINAHVVLEEATGGRHGPVPGGSGGRLRRNAARAAGGGAGPAAGGGVRPAAGGGVRPAAGLGAGPVAGGGAGPVAGEGAQTVAGGGARLSAGAGESPALEAGAAPVTAIGATPPTPWADPAPLTPARRQPARVGEPERVLLLSAADLDALAALLGAEDAAVLDAGLDPARTHGDAGPVRLGVVDPTAKRLALARRAVAKGRAWHGRGDVWFRPGPLLGRAGGKVVFVFPGLEADFTPRTDDIAAHFGLPPVAGAGPDVRVGDIGRHGFGVVGVGRLLDQALRRMGVVPDAVAGHSVGEWTAMAAAGIYSAAQVDQFMAGFDPDAVTVPGLAFAAVGTSADHVRAALAGTWADSGIVLSHDNAPRQSMVCGPGQAVADLARALRAEGVLCQVLPFRSGFHTPMLEPYLAPIKEAADRFRLHPPTVPVWSGTTAAPFPRDEPAVRELFVRHLLEPVRFRELTEALYAAGHRVFVQTGPGRLPSLIGDTLGDRDHLAVAANSPHHSGLAQLRCVATALWTAGASVAPYAPPRTPAAGPAVTRPPVRLDLGSALVSLDGPTREALRAQLRPTPRTDESARPAPSGTPALDALAVHHPAAAELTALLRDTATTAAELITASHRPASRPPTPAGPRAATSAPVPTGAPAATSASVPAGTRAATSASAPAGTRVATSAPVPAVTRVATSAPVPAGTRAATSASAPAGGPAGAPTATKPSTTTTAPTATTPPATPGTLAPATPAPTSAPTSPATTTSLHISPHSMPHLLDHCFFRQRPGWPDLEDRWPVVPATTIVRHMMEAAEAAAPGLRAVAVHGARFDRWLTAVPPVDVPVTVAPDPDRPDDRVTVTLGPTARAVVELAPQHPAPPPPGALPAGPERVPDHTAAQLYRDRWMFHGPRFQGLTELTALGERHIRGVITTPAAPGALLDNVGQLLGYWIMATRTERTVVFPVQLGRARFHGPHPEPGTEVHCLLRITSLTDTVLEADAELTVGGRVWARLTGWQDRRFDNDPTTRPVERFPERHTLSTAMPGGWALVHERWPDLASRELIMRNSLGGAERAEYAERPPRGRRQWLLGRIAVKDAVRHLLWQQGEGPVFPAELRVGNDELGRPYVTGVHGRELPPLDVSLAHRAEAAVAIVRPYRPQPGPGIDIEEVADRDPATLTTALGPAELRLLRARCADGGDAQAVWFTRFWAAKEAVAKAEGVGFGGRPRDFAVLETAPDGSRLLVSGRLERAYTVHCAPAANPPALPRRTYVVAWTAGPGADDGPPGRPDAGPPDAQADAQADAPAAPAAEEYPR